MNVYPVYNFLYTFCYCKYIYLQLMKIISYYTNPRIKKEKSYKIPLKRVIDKAKKKILHNPSIPSQFAGYFFLWLVRQIELIGTKGD